MSHCIKGYLTWLDLCTSASGAGESVLSWEVTWESCTRQTCVCKRRVIVEVRRKTVIIRWRIVTKTWNSWERWMKVAELWVRVVNDTSHERVWRSRLTELSDEIRRSCDGVVWRACVTKLPPVCVAAETRRKCEAVVAVSGCRPFLSPDGPLLCRRRDARLWTPSTLSWRDAFFLTPSVESVSWPRCPDLE